MPAAFASMPSLETMAYAKAPKQPPVIGAFGLIVPVSTHTNQSLGKALLLLIIKTRVERLSCICQLLHVGGALASAKSADRFSDARKSFWPFCCTRAARKATWRFARVCSTSRKALSIPGQFFS